MKNALALLGLGTIAFLGYSVYRHANQRKAVEARRINWFRIREQIICPN